MSSQPAYCPKNSATNRKHPKCSRLSCFSGLCPLYPPSRFLKEPTSVPARLPPRILIKLPTRIHDSSYQVKGQRWNSGKKTYSELYHQVPRIIVTTIIIRKRQNCGSLEVTLVAVIMTLHVLNYILPDSILQAKKLLMCTATFGEMTLGMTQLIFCYCTASRHTTDDPKSSERRPSTWHRLFPVRDERAL